MCKHIYIYICVCVCVCSAQFLQSNPDAQKVAHYLFSELWFSARRAVSRTSRFFVVCHGRTGSAVGLAARLRGAPAA